jgi:hypothetical protein
MARQDDRWPESIAVGSERFVEQVKNELDFRAQRRPDDLYTPPREPVPPYGDPFDRENCPPRPNNTVPWKTNLETTEASPVPLNFKSRYRFGCGSRERITGPATGSVCIGVPNGPEPDSTACFDRH